MIDDFNLNDITGDANAGAYRIHESRSGPPLDYISEKLEHALEDLHAMARWVDRMEPGTSVAEAAAMNAKGAFRHVLVAFSALHNVLGLANEPSLVSRLLAYSTEKFQEWLLSMRSEGSIRG